MRFARYSAVAGLIAALAWPVRADTGAAPGSLPAAAPAAAPGPLPLQAYSAVGSSLAHTTHIADLGWTDEQMTAFLEGMRAGLHGRDYPFDDNARQLLDEIGRRIAELDAKEKPNTESTFSQPGRLEQFMKEARKRYSLQISETGLGYSVHPGRGGARPRPGDVIVVSCSATGPDGTTKLPQLAADHIKVKMSGLLPGLMEGLQMMTADGQAIFVVPASLSFANGNWPEGVEPGSPLIFFVTLHEVIGADATP